MSSRVSHRRSSVPRWIGAALLTLIVSVGAQAQEAGIAVGTRAPAAHVQSLEGDSLDLASFYGRIPVVLEFWATWCPLCRQLEPAMREAREEFGDRVTFVSVGVSANQSPARQRAYTAANGIGGELVFDRFDAAVKAFRVPHTSYVVVIDALGVVTYTGVGGDQDIRAAIRTAFR